MDYEKEYKEALERAREYHKVDKDNTLKLYAKGTMEYLFPELKESESERIRKELIKLLRNLFNNYSYFIKDPFYTECIAWLEKQGEKKDIHLMELKAKAYDDAKERMSYAYNKNRVSIEFVNEIFPDIKLYELYANQGEQKPAWSEEDEHWRQKAINFMKHPDLIKATPTLAKDTIDWLKSLKQRIEE